MGLFRASRASQPDAARSTVGLRMAIFAAGAALAVLGIATESSWLVYTAAGVLAVGVVLRFVSRRNP